jgi:phenylacetate-coenzyme A ligase PaaK-like adenylate-forming protein
MDRWFARRVPMNSRAEATFHHVMTSLIVLATRFFGPGAPWPEFIDSDELGRIVAWMIEQKKEGKLSCLRTTVSNAVRIARIAHGMGQSLAGMKFMTSGEPLTESKRAAIERVESTVIPGYGAGGFGEIGHGCGNPRQTDEVHVSLDRLAVIQHPRPRGGDGLPIHPFLFTTLTPLAPKLFLNVENGDYGVMETRDCGCCLESTGLTLHLHHIRSFEKLTSEGMSYYYGDLHELFENTFPAEFGGGPGDYQLVEEEDGNGQTRLTLVVRPDIGELDEEKILGRLRAALADGSRGKRFMAWVWQDAGTFRIKREPPYASARGKILPLHIPKRNQRGTV